MYDYSLDSVKYTVYYIPDITTCFPRVDIADKKIELLFELFAEERNTGISFRTTKQKKKIFETRSET